MQVEMRGRPSCSFIPVYYFIGDRPEMQTLPFIHIYKRNQIVITPRVVIKLCLYLKCLNENVGTPSFSVTTS